MGVMHKVVVLLDLVRAALADLERLRMKLEALQAQLEQEGSEGNKTPTLKHPNGRLTEAGLQRLRDLIDAGRADSEIARELEVTQPAVLQQRRKYLAAKAAPR